MRRRSIKFSAARRSSFRSKTPRRPRASRFASEMFSATESHGADPRGSGRKKILELAPHHGSNEFTEVPTRHGAFLDGLAISQHAHSVGDLRQFFQAMGDKDNRRAFGF